ncbi:hypothetical protein SKAU_G00286870 [Synaphobranchus kaupii]|uniref:Uncharacterized protein n=1 Tax=Synaphobranchus kaupii TaxID=118154 RepID=A0A9Q1EY73_SYNKA|nr:hypothetical protein SKAU_G00286870 [Synaphobranchus kaupii]
MSAETGFIYLVTGVCRFLGRHLLQVLLEKEDGLSEVRLPDKNIDPALPDSSTEQEVQQEKIEAVGCPVQEICQGKTMPWSSSDKLSSCPRPADTMGTDSKPVITCEEAVIKTAVEAEGLADREMTEEGEEVEKGKGKPYTVFFLLWLLAPTVNCAVIPEPKPCAVCWEETCATRVKTIWMQGDRPMRLTEDIQICSVDNLKPDSPCKTSDGRLVLWTGQQLRFEGGGKTFRSNNTHIEHLYNIANSAAPNPTPMIPGWGIFGGIVAIATFAIVIYQKWCNTNGRGQNVDPVEDKKDFIERRVKRLLKAGIISALTCMVNSILTDQTKEMLASRAVGEMDVLEKKSQSLNQTSTGIGHVYRGPLPSDINIESQRGDSLPPLLSRPRLLPPSRHFSSSVRLEHDRKPLAGPLTHPRYSKAVPHWTVNFVDGLGDRLRDCHTARMISPPVSETQDRYRGQSTPQRPEAQHYAPLLALNRQFETNKVPALNMPNISTTHADYRRFSRSELFAPSSFDEGAYRNMPPPKAPPTVSWQPFLHRPLQHVPHGGQTTIYRDSYTIPSSPLAMTIPDLPDWSSAQAGRGLVGHILKVPKMYSTENQDYGGNKRVLV